MSRPQIPPDQAAGSGAEPAAQHSAPERVNTGVSSAALDRGFLGMAALVSETKDQAEEHNAIPSAELTDADVMLRVKAGDSDAFDYLVQKYRRSMISFMYRTARNQGSAEDLAQEVFLRVYRSREGYEASAKFTTWLYRIATNLAMNYARDTKHERPENTVRVDETNGETGLSFDIPDGALSAEQKLVQRERLLAIRSRVLELPERQRMAVIMHKYQAMDYREIGEILKLSESATKSLLFRAYQTLREQLREFV